MKKFSLIFTSVILILLVGCQKSSPREVRNFNSDWRFSLDAGEEAIHSNYNDSEWRVLDLPHDWSIEGDFSESHPATAGGGALPGGLGWYRKSFHTPALIENKKLIIEFDGVYMNSTVYVNDSLVGNRPNGYISFSYDITPFLKNGGEENVIVVKVDNSKQPNSRWYSGSGIYRNVRLVTLNPVHVVQWGTYVTTPTISKEKAVVEVETTIKNGLNESQKVILQSKIINTEGENVGVVKTEETITADSVVVYKQMIEVAQPELWSVDSPYLYTLLSTVSVNGVVVDNYETNVGIRSFEFDPYKGFFLNGESMKILGVCNHHDLGCLGAAVNKRAIERQLEILKEMGCNSIRTSHNPPAIELLDLCDQMGFIVQDETFDMWRKKKSPFDYAQYFNEWHEIDLTDHIIRDRNHPSVMMWSVGNEVLEQWNDVNTDTLDLQQANTILNFEKNVDADIVHSDEMHVNSLIATKLVNIAKSVDPTRPVTSANNETNPNNFLFKSNAMDIYGFNYHHQNFIPFHDNFPGKRFIVSESTSGLMTRGFYQMPSDSMFVWPEPWGADPIPFGNPEQQCSAYDNCHVPWGSTHEDTWRIVKNYKHISGLYVWTGFDYLGEPTPYWWPSRSSYFGIIDLAGFPKDIYYMYQSEWTNKDVLHIFPHWNWAEGEDVDVWAYYNNADEVELFLNGKSLGIRHKDIDEFHVMWRVVFQPGELKAVSRKNGQVVLEKVIKTAGSPASINLLADRNELKADGEDLSFITVDINDLEGNFMPIADNHVEFKIEGPGRIVGVDNGNPVSHESFKAHNRKAFNGKCLVVVQSTGESGEIILTGKSEGLASATCTLIAE